MTSMEKAQEALRLARLESMEQGGDWDLRLGTERCVTAYLTALAADEATVERVAKAIDPDAYREGDARGHTPAIFFERGKIESRESAKRALLALTPTPKTRRKRIAPALEFDIRLHALRQLLPYPLPSKPKRKGRK